MAYLYKSTMVNSRVDTGKSDCPEMSPQKGWETYGETALPMDTNINEKTFSTLIVAA